MTLARILADEDLRNELQQKLGQRGPGDRTWGIVGGNLSTRLSRDILRVALEHPDSLVPGADEREAIIHLFGRPVLLVRRSSFDAETFEDPESQVWVERLREARTFLKEAIPAVGRVEVRDHPSLSWVGTGWLVADGVLVTNRHVADEFAYRTGDSYEFHRNPEGRRMRASVNFRCEYQEDEESEHLVEKVLHIEDPNGPDVALLKLRKTSTVGDPLPEPIALADELLQLGQRVAVIGYPAVDGHRNDWAVMERIYRGIYGVKRLAPGEIMTIQPTHFTHDCTTLGGNSGSVVVNLATGRAVGLHFAGAYASANYAVPAPLLAERIKVLGLGQ